MKWYTNPVKSQKREAELVCVGYSKRKDFVFKVIVFKIQDSKNSGMYPVGPQFTLAGKTQLQDL